MALRNLHVLRASCCSIESKTDVTAAARDSESGITYAACTDSWLWQVEEGSNTVANKSLGIEKRDYNIQEMAFLEDQKFPVVLTTCGKLCYGDPPQLVMMERPTRCMRSSPDGSLLAIVDLQGTLSLIETISFCVIAEEPIPELEGEAVKEAEISWRDDSACFAVLLQTRTAVVQVWDRELRCLTTGFDLDPNQEALSISWGASGTLIAVGLPGQVQFFERVGYLRDSLPLPQANLGEKPIEIKWSSDSSLMSVVSSSSSGISVQFWHRSNHHWYLKRVEPFVNEERVWVLWDEFVPGKVTLVASTSFIVSYEFSWLPSISHAGTCAVIDGNQVLLTPFSRCVCPPPFSLARIYFDRPVLEISWSPLAVDETFAALLDDHMLKYITCPGGEDNWHSEWAEEDIVNHQGLQLAERKQLVRGLSYLPSGGTVLMLGSRKGCATEIVHCGAGNEITTIACINPPSRFVMCSSCEKGTLYVLDEGYQKFIEASGKTVEMAKYIPNVEPLLLRLVRSKKEGADEGDDSIIPFCLTSKGEFYRGIQLLSSKATSFVLHLEGRNIRAAYTTSEGLLRFVPTSVCLYGGQYVEADVPEASSERSAGSLAPDEMRSMMYLAMQPKKLQQMAYHVGARAIEEGSVAICSPPAGVEVILECPRGNLECATPRQFVLPQICKCISRGQWDFAHHLCARNQINASVLIDLGWPLFLAHANEFARQVASPEAIADFIETLSTTNSLESDELKTVCQDIEWPTPSVEAMRAWRELSGLGKINAVLSRLMEALEKLGKEEYLIPYLNSYLFWNPPQYESALREVKRTREKELNGKCPSIRSDDATWHLKTVLGGQKVVQLALGIYDLELAYYVITLVAEEDPSEYVPLLKKWQSIESPRFEAEIDKYLGRWESALEHLAACGEDNLPECIRIASEHKLFATLLRVFSESEECLRRVRYAYAQTLDDAHRHEDAAVGFFAANDMERAMQAYRKAGNWKAAMYVAKQCTDRKQQLKFAEELMSDLQDRGDFLGAAEIAEHHLKDVDQAVAVLATAKDWRTAFTVSSRYDRDDLIDTVIGPAVAEEAGETLQNLKAAKERTEKYWQRLQELRNKRHQLNAALLGEQEYSVTASGEKAWDADAESVESSAISHMSVYTSTSARMGGSVAGSPSGQQLASEGTSVASTRGARKREKKRLNAAKKAINQPTVRHGGPHEELALAVHLLQVVPTKEELEMIANLAEALVWLDHNHDATKLQSAAGHLVDLHAQATEDVRRNRPPNVEDAKEQFDEALSRSERSQAAQWKWAPLRS